MFRVVRSQVFSCEQHEFTDTPLVGTKRKREEDTEGNLGTAQKEKKGLIFQTSNGFQTNA